MILEKNNVIDAAAFAGTCPLPITNYKEITLAHGSGGKLTQQLIDQLLLPSFRNEFLEPLHDGAVLNINGTRLAFSTDSYVVSPIFFPGGDIGELAVNGTVNDLAMCGAKPLYLSSALVIEEGFSMENFWRIMISMRSAAEKAGVLLVTGDTKVVERGKGDQIYVNTSGIGIIPDGIDIRPSRVRKGDKIIVSGPIAVHGIAIMSVREGLEFETEIRSDTAALHGLVETILSTGCDIHMLRDATRGGLSGVLAEIAQSVGVCVEIDENKIPIDEEVKGACEILGLDPLHVANEGKLVAIVPAACSERVLSAMHAHPLGARASLIGEITEGHNGMVIMRTAIGGTRVVDRLSGEQLPRIC